MTAPRMEDTHWRHLVRYLGRRDPHVSQVADEGDRARSSESALLARVERLEGALGAFADAVERGHVSPSKDCALCRALKVARAALSEPT